MNRIAIITDLGNVLVSFRERTEVIGHALRAFQNGREDQELHKKILNKIFPNFENRNPKDDLYHHLDIGEIDLEYVFDVICEVGKIDRNQVNYARFFALFCQHLEPILPVIELYLDLQRKYPILTVSNGDAGSRHAVDLLQGYHGIQFAEVFVSCECRRRKPELLQDVRNHLVQKGFDPSQCPFIDDVKEYVVAANHYGLRGIQFNATQQNVTVLRDTLRHLGITPPAEGSRCTMRLKAD